jgi:hypothetical protein
MKNQVVSVVSVVGVVAAATTDTGPTTGLTFRGGAEDKSQKLTGVTGGPILLGGRGGPG